MSGTPLDQTDGPESDDRQAVFGAAVGFAVDAMMVVWLVIGPLIGPINRGLRGYSDELSLGERRSSAGLERFSRMGEAASSSS
jgi:hypothetical protein